MKPCGRTLMYGKGREDKTSIAAVRGICSRTGKQSCMSVSHALYQHRLPCVRLWLVHGSLLSGLHSMENAFPRFTLSDRKFSSVPTQNAVGTGFAYAGRLYFAGRQCHPVRPTDENRYLIQPNRVTTITHQTVTTNQTKGDPPK